MRCTAYPHMAYYNQQINFAEVFAQIDKDFPVKHKPNPEPRSAVFCERHIEFRGETADWLREMPALVEDQQIVAFVRVGKTLTHQGARIHRYTPKPIPHSVNTHKYLQTYVDRYGLCLEALNAGAEVVRKYHPSENLRVGKAFI